MATIADFSRKQMNDFADTNLLLIDILVDQLCKHSPRIDGLGQFLTDSSGVKHLRNYGNGQRSAYLFMSDKELNELPANVRDELDIITAFRGISETVSLAAHFCLLAEARETADGITKEDVEFLQRASSITQTIIRHGNDVERTILSMIHSSYDRVISLPAITAAQRGSDIEFDLAVASILRRR